MSSKRRRPNRNAAKPSASTPVEPIETVEPMEVSAPEVAPPPRPTPRQTIHENERLGDILRRVREHRGEGLEEISDYLRIRPGFLYALENSRYDQLPADAYVIGFLRTYAQYLGLDGRGAIDQYRREMAGRRRKPQLSMPQPMSEGRAPTLTVIVGAVLAALLIYGIWYGLSSPDKDVLEQPVPLPTSAGIEIPAPVSTTAEEITPTEPPAPAATETAPAKAEPAPAKAEPAPAAKNEEPKTAPEKTEPPQAAPPKSEEPKAQKPEEPKPEDAPKPQTEAPQPPPPQAEQPASRTFGETGKARVTIRAEKDSWVLVTDSKGLTVFDRTLKAGESYNVPTGKALSLTTGNVAGVAFTIDGKEMPKLPANGRVARGVALDPEKLKTRLTTPQAEQPSAGDTTSQSQKTGSTDQTAID